MQTPTIRVRFAPSPTGMLHVGNARTALYNWLFARHSGGDFLLRIEDTDVERSEVRYESQLMEDLRWLGLDWTEGPQIGGPYGPYRQSERLPIYQQHTEQLLSEGKAYRCFCTAEELEKEKQESVQQQRLQIYSGRCRLISPADSAQRAAVEPFAVRLRVPDSPLRFHDIVRGDVEFAADAVGDFILVRSSGIPVYNYVVTVDDALMEITHVIRGDDHISNTPRQVAIYQAFSWTPPHFAHLSTILGSDRERLSKRHGATSVASFREMGILPEALANYLALLGWGAEGGLRETFTLPELVDAFKLERVTPSPAVFDWDKLHWLNRHFIKQAPLPQLRALAYPYFSTLEWLPAQSTPALDVWCDRVLELFLPAVDELRQLPEKAALLWQVPSPGEEDVATLRSESGEKVRQSFTAKVAAAEGMFTAQRFKDLVNEVKTETGVKGKDLFHPIRILLTGSHSGPEFDKLIPLMEEGSQLDLPRRVLGVRDRLFK
jgi:nondiscriminating glutamyl-tRNA synthetase